MIRRWLITLALIIVVPLAVYLFISRTRVVPWDECSELYRRYADCPGVEAAYIKDYRVNDTLTLCATVLEATTDTAWAELQKDFDFKPYPPEILELIKNTNSVEWKYVKHGTSCGQMDSIPENNDVVAISHFKHYIIIFDQKSAADVIAILYKQTRDSYL